MRSAKTFIACTLVLVLTTFAACSKSSSDSAQGSDKAAEGFKGIVLAQGAAFYRGENPDALEWAAALDFGVTFRTDAQVSSHIVNGEMLPLVAVELPAEASGLNGSGSITGWVRESQVAIGKAGEVGDLVAAVVTGRDAELSYRDGKNPANKVLPRLTLVCFRQEQSTDLAGQVFVYDNITDSKYEYRVLKEVLSFKGADVKAATLVQKAVMARDEAEKRAILEDAERTFGSLEFGDDIRSMLVGDEAATEEDEDSIETESLVTTMTVKGLNTQIFDGPSVETREVASIGQDDEVSVVARTVQQFEVWGNSARWYKVDSPWKGWIFGSFLEGAD